MTETQPTASEIISFVEKLEEASATFYEELGKRFEREKETFSAFAKESRNNKTNVMRTYQETITDALEACFCFKGLEIKDYSYQTVLTDTTSFSDAVKTATDLETRAIAFYLEIAKRSMPFLATIPRAFKKVADVREKRKSKLQSMNIEHGYDL